jgi:hypothetical protein
MLENGLGDSLYFQIWYSLSQGFVIDVYPFVQVQVSNTLIVSALAVIVVLRVRKVLRDKKGNKWTSLR